MKGRWERTVRLAALFASIVTVNGCERGCLWRALADRGIGVTPGGSNGAPKEWFGEIDCPDGLLRCVGGELQASALAHRPSHCTGNPEACACPWTTVDRCEGECVVDRAEVLLPLDKGKRQLCAGAPLPPNVGGLTPLSPLGDACEGELFVCLGGAVVSCQSPPHVVGNCLSRCAVETLAENGSLAPTDDAKALALLCSR